MTVKSARDENYNAILNAKYNKQQREQEVGSIYEMNLIQYTCSMLYKCEIKMRFLGSYITGKENEIYI